ncbi:MAG: O-methyltransferase [Propylenella sp.]
MSERSWTEIDRRIAGLFASDPAIDAALKASDSAGLPAIEVAPPHGKLLMLLALIRGARKILEIGTLGGYSTIWMARALPADGRLVSLEADESHAELAQRNIALAGLSGVVEVRLGRALDTLPKLAKEGAGPFDMIFIDADKENNPAYFDWAVKLSRPGGVIVVDNVVRYGAQDTKTYSGSVRSFMALVADDARVSATVVQTVSIKGHDGFLLAVVKGGG